LLRFINPGGGKLLHEVVSTTFTRSLRVPDEV